MYEDLRDKVVIVAGGSGGIGASQVRKLDAAGAHVVVADRDEDAGRKLVAELGGDRSLFVRIDVSVPADWEMLVDRTMARFARIDGLSNSFGIAPQSSLEELSLEQYSTVVSVNQAGTFLGIRSVFPHMIGRGGSIVNVASGAAYRALPYHFAYAATKAAIIAMTRDAAAELGQHNIRVNCISPGAIRTNLQAATVAQWQRRRPAYDDSQAFAAHPLGRIGEPDEVAEAMLFFLSDASSYCTGTSLLVDGGIVAGSRP
ncbi:SDR family oxidoreductase [Dactylosporangium sp. NPDC000555]|uniref:SDR family NAD(P)-dependent oxidoreductase n=1 Tax=Dactylosporangium sp. NPDC000555 TaxID=3154260 RepID=UPI0033182A74